MLTDFGKFCRKLRIDKDELLKDMAEKLNVTSSYLSAVENGKRDIPDSWELIIIEKYCLSKTEAKELNEAIYVSQKQLKISLDSLRNDDKDLVLSFARKFEDLTDENKNTIRKLLNR